MLVVDTIETDNSRQLLVPQTLDQVPLSDTNRLTVEAVFGQEFIEKFEDFRHYCIVGAVLTSSPDFNDPEAQLYDEAVHFLSMCNRPFLPFASSLHEPFELTLQFPEDHREEYRLNFVLLPSSMAFTIKGFNLDFEAYRTWLTQESMFNSHGWIDPSIYRSHRGQLASAVCPQKIRVTELCTTGV